MAERLAQLSGHLTASYSRGLLKGDVAIITGAGQGIGRAAALLFAKEGAKVVLCDLDGQKAESVAREILENDGDAMAIPGDVMADHFPQQVVRETIGKYGKINHIVNNAGFASDRMFHSTSDESFDLIMNVHVRAPFRLIREAAPYFRIKDPSIPRSIINVSSTSGLHGSAGQANYATAKSALLGLTKTLAKEWGPAYGVRCNTVAFGIVDTRLVSPMENGQVIQLDEPGSDGCAGKKHMARIGIPRMAREETIKATVLRRPGTPEEAAAAILFLASPLSSFVTGHTLEVSGGFGL